jgi:hypothetical protein
VSSVNNYKWQMTYEMDMVGVWNLSYNITILLVPFLFGCEDSFHHGGDLDKHMAQSDDQLDFKAERKLEASLPLLTFQLEAG